jgi:hypothetical protein
LWIDKPSYSHRAQVFLDANRPHRFARQSRLLFAVKSFACVASR